MFKHNGWLMTGWVPKWYQMADDTKIVPVSTNKRFKKTHSGQESTEIWPEK